MVDWKTLLDAVRSACPVGLWSKGVELARDGAVAGEEHDEETWTFRVRTPGRPIAPTVSLYLDDCEWECDCDARFDACEHAAACVMAVSQSADGPLSFFGAEQGSGSIRYELRRSQQGLDLERFFVEGDAPPRRVEQPIVDMLARRSPDLTVSPTHADIDVDRLVGRRPGESIGFDRAARLLRALVSVGDLRLDGDPVRASSEPLFPCARLADGPGASVELVIEADPEVAEVVAPGVLRSGDTLHPFGAEERFGKSWERLPLRRTFGRERMAELVGTVLPELRRHISVDVRTDRLPDVRRSVAPWVQFDVDMVDGGVDVLPLLVYDEPPAARIDDGRLVHLRGDVPARDEPAEKQLVLRLRDRLNLVPGRRVRFAGTDAARFLSDLESFADGRQLSPGARLAVGPRRATLVARLETAGEEVELVFDVAGGDGDEPAGAGGAVAAEAVVNAWRDGVGLVPLLDGSFASVPAAWLDAHGHLVSELLSARAQNEGRTPRAALPVLGELCAALDAPPPLELERLRALLESVPGATADASAASDVVAADGGCASLHGELRGYQAAGVAWLLRLRDAGLGAVLADDMGLGKTVQALCAVRGRTLVVSPRSVIHNWVREIERFRPDLAVNLYHGPKRALDLDRDELVTLTTYATLRNDADTLCDVDWDVVVLDEAQNIKNPDSQAARAAYRLRAEFRLSLSGTPIENRPAELWSQMHFTNRGLLGGRRDFTDRYERPMLAGDSAALELLRRRIRPFVLRRLKRDVATELPPRTEAVMTVELDDGERATYDAVRMATRADVARQLGEGSGVMAALEALLRLRQAACHRGLLPDTDAARSSKIDALCEALDDAVADGHKALVFSQWTGLLDRVEPHLEARAVAFTRLDGKTRDREAVVDRFQDAAGPPILLVSLTAGGTGLNLTAADHVFLLDPWWNPAVEDQAADRAHRIGQDRPVTVYRLVAKDTVEERVLDLQRRKRELAEGVLGGDAAGATTITREEILALLD